ncbi:hypothetical protein BDZ85DRAFT_19090 [Elsinoe ampelina]|uniref:FYVE-type domain-containing protein n=1 Tax=Elsinoe ampelina TaxID=302913 RepID=A0A6A6G7F6_9PEZI|nr:hypothetical protein BDZ85DRAFT_19090 [Elsinoe ampelina]
MATSFQQPQNAHQFQQHNAYYRQTYSQPANFTPPSSVTPPNSKISPTNVANPPKQIYAQRSCGYVPAALRPTVPARVRRPDTPPRSAQSSFESQSPSQQSRSSKSLPVTPTDDVSSFMAPLSQVTRVVTDEWNEELGEVTGQPTRGHWKPDASVTCCTSPTCGTVFSLLARRHHCRRCGGIYCFVHSSRNVPLDQEARFHPKGSPGRACDNCYSDYKIWQSERKSRASSITSGGTCTPPVHSMDGPEIRGSDFLGIEQRKQQTNNHLTNQESVSDWNWSTF